MEDLINLKQVENYKLIQYLDLFYQFLHFIEIFQML